MKLRFGRLAAALVVIGLLIFGVSLITGGGKKTPSTSVQVQKSLTDYASTDATVSLKIKGIINGDELHREILITVGRDLRSLNIIQGYQGTVIKNQNYYNNQPAYDEFLHAINRANFSKQRKSSAPKSDSGVCPLGNRYVFTLSQGGRDISSLWSATCSGVGTSAANSQTLLTLFQNQIPDYAKLTRDVSLSTTASPNP